MTAHIEDIIAKRENDLRSGPLTSLVAFCNSQLLLHELSTDDRNSLLFELAALELEYRWRNATPLAPQPTAITLANDFPELSAESYLLPLIAEEFRVRTRWGDRPSIEEFAAKFGVHQSRIRTVLEPIAHELRVEFGLAPKSPIVLVPTGFDPRAPLSSADYLVERFIGAGSFGRVYVAHQRSLDRTVALKFLRKAYLHSELAVERFLQEARIAGGLRHPGIVAIHGLGRTPAGNYFIAMDLVPGAPLQPVDISNPLQIQQLLNSIAQAAEAMTVAHAKGVVHCDLKPANILCDQHRRITLTDFGLARQIARDEEMLSVGEGTPACIAPEQIDRCRGSMGPMTDVFGLAATLYLLLTGESVHAGRSVAEIVANAVSGRPVLPILSHCPSLPASLNTFLNECLTKSPPERLATISEFAIRLRAIAVQNL